MLTKRSLVFVLLFVFLLILEGCNVLPTPISTTYSITSTAGENGLIEPEGTITVIAGENQTIAIIPNEGYKVADVLVDGVSVGAVDIYKFQDIQQDYTIQASFVALQYTLTIGVVGEGATTPAVGDHTRIQGTVLCIMLQL